MADEPALALGQRVVHSQFGDGVVVGFAPGGHVRVFFGTGERQVPAGSLRTAVAWTDRVLAGLESTPGRLREVWLTLEAQALPLLESAAALTAARVDLLPHQIVLTHHVASGSPRRLLVADEVGLGKTIETALILRELASRGDLRRALMIVPAGLVSNWHRELNEVFNLHFEVFGVEGDVTDRRSNAFAKHDRLIASVDTLKRPARIRRLLEAPPWDLIVFDEAHHLTALRTGGKVRKTANYKLAEALREHTRDLILLSATPHQGDHFRFWMLVQLLNPTLFRNPEEMLECRHRLNSVVVRRTKADACRADGSPLFARRWVHTESFVMGEAERSFYHQLCSYLEEGFALARRVGGKGRALGFVMSIFQKIAASSFAAVRATLRRRLLMLTLHEGILCDRELDVDGRAARFDEARELIRLEYRLGSDPVSEGQVDRILAELKLKLLQRLDEEELALASDAGASEYAAANAEEMAAMAVQVALPHERRRIQALLTEFPVARESKVEKLLTALGALWRQDPSEKIVIFATYLGTVELLGREIELAYPGQGVVVLRGGDHGAKLAAERRFRAKEGPRVLVCTAAGREGINLQFARILFNFDLPWNPMDVEQRIGRIHRYGQIHTAQVYNLVLSDTIEGRIFLLLDSKLQEIARAVGKVDEQGHVAEDLRSQVLGQLAERLSYDRLYQEALSDPELHRTRLELEAALANASEARRVVFDLFQDLDGFRLDDYQPFSDVAAGIDRVVRFLERAAKTAGHQLVRLEDGILELRSSDGGVAARFTRDRDEARSREDVAPVGLDHPVVEKLLTHWRELAAEQRAVAIEWPGGQSGVQTWWLVEAHREAGDRRLVLLPLAVATSGARLPSWEKQGMALLEGHPAQPVLDLVARRRLLAERIEPMLGEELRHRGLVSATGSYTTKLVAWVEVVPGD